MKLIYILEDDMSICKLTSILLSRKGYEVRSFYNVKNFMEALKAQVPDFMLIDVMLPDGNGLDLTFEFKKRAETKIIPILIMSANADCHYIKNEFSDVDFIAKPFDIHNFSRKVDSLMAPPLAS